MSNADTLRHVFSLMDERNDSALRELLAPDFQAVFAGNPPMDVDEWAGMGAMMYAAFPDGRHEIHETFELGDRVALRGSFSGTHSGDFMGMPPTGREITITFLNLDRFADGKLGEHRAEVAMLGLLQQLGAIPSMTTA